MNEEEIKTFIEWFSDEEQKDYESGYAHYYEVGTKTPMLDDYVEEKLRKFFLRVSIGV